MTVDWRRDQDCKSRLACLTNGVQLDDLVFNNYMYLDLMKVHVQWSLRFDPPNVRLPSILRLAINDTILIFQYRYPSSLAPLQFKTFILAEWVVLNCRLSLK